MIFLFCEIDFYEYGLPQLKEYTERAAVCTDIEEWKESVLSGYRVARQELERKFDITGAEAARWEQAALKYIEEQEAAWVYEKAREELLKFDYSQRVEAFEAVIEGVAASGKDALKLANQLRKGEAARLEEAVEERAAQVKARWLSELKSSVAVEEFKRLVELAAARLKAEWRGELDEAARRAFAGVFERGGDQLRKEAESQRAEDRLSWILYEIRKDIEELTPTLEGIKRIKDPVEFREKWKEAIGEVVKRGLKKWALAIETVEGLKKEWIDQAVEDREEGESRWEAAYRELLKEREAWRRQIKQLIEEGRQLWEEKYQEFNRNLTEAQKEYDEYWNQVEESYSRILEDASGVGQIASGIEQAGEAIEFYKKLGESEKASKWEELQSDLESALDDIKEEIEKVVLNPEGLLGDEIKQLWGEDYDLALIYTPEGQNYIKAKAALAWWEKKLQIAEYARAYMSGNYDISWWIKPYETWESEPTEEEIEAACAILGVDPARGAEAVEKYFNYELHTDYDIIDWELATRILKQVAYSRYQAAKEKAKEALADIAGSKATVSGIWDYIKQMQAEEKTLRDSYGAYIIAYQALQDKEQWMNDIEAKVEQIWGEVSGLHSQAVSDFTGSIKALIDYAGYNYLLFNQEALKPYQEDELACSGYSGHLEYQGKFSDWISGLSNSQVKSLNPETENLLRSLGIKDWGAAQTLKGDFKKALTNWQGERGYTTAQALYRAALELSAYYSQVAAAIEGYTAGLKGEELEDSEKITEFELLKERINQYKEICKAAQDYLSQWGNVETAKSEIEQVLETLKENKQEITPERAGILTGAHELLEQLSEAGIEVSAWLSDTISLCDQAITTLEELGHVPKASDLDSIKETSSELALLLYGVRTGFELSYQTIGYQKKLAFHKKWLAWKAGRENPDSITKIQEEFENLKTALENLPESAADLAQAEEALEDLEEFRLPFEIKTFITELTQKIKATFAIAEAGGYRLKEEEGNKPAIEDKIEETENKISKLTELQNEICCLSELGEGVPFSQDNIDTVKKVKAYIESFLSEQTAQQIEGLQELKAKLENYLEKQKSWKEETELAENLPQEEQDAAEVSQAWYNCRSGQTSYTPQDAPEEFRLYVIWQDYKSWQKEKGGSLDDYLKAKKINLADDDKKLIERVESGEDYILLLNGEAALTEARIRVEENTWDETAIPADHPEAEEIKQAAAEYINQKKEIENLDPWDTPQTLEQKLYRYAGWAHGVVYDPAGYHAAMAKVYQQEGIEAMADIKNQLISVIENIETESQTLSEELFEYNSIYAYLNKSFEYEDYRLAAAYIPAEVNASGIKTISDYTQAQIPEAEFNCISEGDEAVYQILQNHSLKNHKLELYIKACSLIKHLKENLQNLALPESYDQQQAESLKNQFESLWNSYQSTCIGIASQMNQMRKRLITYHLLSSAQGEDQIIEEINKFNGELEGIENDYLEEINKKYGIQAETPYEAYTKAVEAYAEALASYDKAVKARLEAYKLYDSATWEHRAAREVYLFATNPYLYKSSEYFADPDFLASLPKYDAEDNYKLVEKKYNQALCVYEEAKAQLEEASQETQQIEEKADQVVSGLGTLIRISAANKKVLKELKRIEEDIDQLYAEYKKTIGKIFLNDEEAADRLSGHDEEMLFKLANKFMDEGWDGSKLFDWGYHPEWWIFKSMTDPVWRTDPAYWYIDKAYLSIGSFITQTVVRNAIYSNTLKSVIMTSPSLGLSMVNSFVPWDLPSFSKLVGYGVCLRLLDGTIKAIDCIISGIWDDINGINQKINEYKEKKRKLKPWEFLTASYYTLCIGLLEAEKFAKKVVLGIWYWRKDVVNRSASGYRKKVEEEKNKVNNLVAEAREARQTYKQMTYQILNITCVPSDNFENVLKNHYSLKDEDVTWIKSNLQLQLETAHYYENGKRKNITGYDVRKVYNQAISALTTQISQLQNDADERWLSTYRHIIANKIKEQGLPQEVLNPDGTYYSDVGAANFVAAVQPIVQNLLSGIKDTKSNIQEGLWDVRRSELEFERERWEQMMQIVYARGNKEWTRAELKFLKAWRKWRKEFDEKFKEGLEKWNRVVKNLEQSRDRWVAQLLREGIKQRSAELARKYLNQIEKQVKAATGRLPARINLRPEDFIPNIPKVATIQGELALWAGGIDTQVEATLADSDLGQMAHHIKAGAGRAQLIRRYTQAFERFIIDRMIDQFNKRKEALQKALYEIEESVRENYEKSFAQTESGSYKGTITGGMQRKVVEDVTILGKATDFISWDTVNKLLSSGMNKEEVTEKLPEWKVIDKKSLELQTKPAFEPSQIAKMAPEDASFLIECLMNRLQEEFEQKQEEIYKHAGAFKGQDLTIPLGSKTIKIQGGTGEVGHISEKFIENEQKAAVGKFRLKEPYWRHRIFDDDYDNDGKPDSWIGSPTVKDAAKILANAIPGAGPLLSFLIDAGDALYSGLVEHNWSAAAGMLGSAVAGFVPGGGSLLGNIASSFAKAGIKEAFSILGEAASNGWDFKKIRLGEHLKGVAISGAVSSFNAWAGAKLGINYQKPGLGDALKMAAVNFGSRTLSFALNEGFKAIEQGTNYRFDWNRAGRQLVADAVLSVAETGAFIAEEKWGDAYSGAWRKHKGFFSRAGLRMADMLISGVKDYTLSFLQNAADRWVEKGGSITVKDLARSSGLAMRAAWSEMGDRGRVQAEMLVRWLIERGVKKVWQGAKWLGSKLWQGVKAAGRWAWSAVTNAPKVTVELIAGIAAQFVHNRRSKVVNPPIDKDFDIFKARKLSDIEPDDTDSKVEEKVQEKLAEYEKKHGKLTGEERRKKLAEFEREARSEVRASPVEGKVVIAGDGTVYVIGDEEFQKKFAYYYSRTEGKMIEDLKRGKFVLVAEEGKGGNKKTRAVRYEKVTVRDEFNDRITLVKAARGSNGGYEVRIVEFYNASIDPTKNRNKWPDRDGDGKPDRPHTLAPGEYDVLVDFHKIVKDDDGREVKIFGVNIFDGSKLPGELVDKVQDYNGFEKIDSGLRKDDLTWDSRTLDALSSDKNKKEKMTGINVHYGGLTFNQQEELIPASWNFSWGCPVIWGYYDREGTLYEDYRIFAEEFGYRKVYDPERRRKIWKWNEGALGKFYLVEQ